MPDATIRDVARKANVSVASVSRALNGLDNVSDDTRARVAEAVRELGYVPHAGARSLSLARTHAVGVVLPDLHGEFFSEIVRGMDREAGNRGYLLLLSTLHPGHGMSVLGALRGRVDGLIVMAPHLDGDALGAALPKGIPSVLLNTRGVSGDHPAIHIDNATGVRAVMGHLIGLGRRQFVHIAGPQDNIDAQERADAFRKAAEEAGCHFRIVEGDFSEESGEAAVAKLLADATPFDAIFGANDNMAIGALQALRSAAVRVPEDVAVAGFDDIPLSRHVGLTTVRVRIAELGERAIACLVDGLESKRFDCSEENHEPELVVRSTTQLES